ncbi:MAG: hypothetical protein JOS17DRAFT_765304 [Linnemannia elongata]|nr:MAG: hypothetical protein JOS17DRAFT_765304 [Linnemannia elongata]
MLLVPLLLQLSLLCYLGWVVTAKLTFISPTRGDEWTFGNSYTIAWTDDRDGPCPSIIDLDLMRGDPSSAQLVLGITGGLSVSGVGHVWLIPGSIEPYDDYFIRASGSLGVSISGPFRITKRT